MIGNIVFIQGGFQCIITHNLVVKSDTPHAPIFSNLQQHMLAFFVAYLILNHGDIDVASKATYEMKGNEKVYSIVQEQAHPADGMTEFYNQLFTNMKYPQQARKLGVEGRVFMEFLVDENGKLSDFKVIRGIGAGCDEEAMRVISLSPNWKPGMQDGVAVKSRFNVAVVFKLN